MGLIIRSSAIHAAGCYTTAAIGKGDRVAEYSGHRLTREQADRIYDSAPITYLFGLAGGQMVIDGHSMAMFINHSCDPNCETEEEGGRVWIRAIRDIAAYEEITYDYCLYDGGDDDALCNCGALECRGTMYSEEEILRRRSKASNAVRQNTSTGNGRYRRGGRRSGGRNGKGRRRTRTHAKVSNRQSRSSQAPAESLTP